MRIGGKGYFDFVNRYEYMMDQIKLAIDELDTDGVYCDEFVLGQNVLVRREMEFSLVGVSGLKVF